MALRMCIAAAAALSVLLMTPAQAQVDARADDRVRLSGDLSDLAFAAGSEVDVDVSSTDDVFAAGGNVRFRGASAENVYGAGGTITFDDVRALNLIAAGGEIRLAGGSVLDDLIVTGGVIELQPDFSVAGTSVVSGGEITISGPLSGGLWAAGGRIVLNSTVGGDVRLEGENVTLGPNARVGGNLTHRARSIDISPQAQITGEVIALPPPAGGWWGGRVTAGEWIASALLGIAMLVVLSCAAVLLVPGLMRDAERAIGERPLTAAGVGLLIIVASPVAVALLAVTVIGIPVAFALLMLLLATAPLAVAAVVHFAAMNLRSLAGRTAAAPSIAARLGWTALAAIALGLVGAIPWVGWLIWFVVYAVGIGAVAPQGARALFRGAGRPGAPVDVAA